MLNKNCGIEAIGGRFSCSSPQESFVERQNSYFGPCNITRGLVSSRNYEDDYFSVQTFYFKLNFILELQR
jgi:hypothetical protein